MGADLRLENQREEAGEPVADIVVRRAQVAPPLHGVEIGGDLIVRAIDELPVLAVLATQAHGRTVVRDAAELRVKETDRIATVAAELRTLGAHIEERPDGFVDRRPGRTAQRARLEPRRSPAGHGAGRGRAGGLRPGAGRGGRVRQRQLPRLRADAAHVGGGDGSAE